MKITVGNALVPIQVDDPSFDELRCNRQVLLEVLEQRLGLSRIRPTTTMVQRVLAYRDALAERLKRDEAVFRQSFEVDPIAVAEELLRWRDELVIAGWDRSCTDLGSQRLKHLAEVETRLATECKCSEGDRLLAVIAELSCRSGGELTVISRDPLTWYPKLWQRLFEKLGAVHEPTGMQLAYANDLQRLQAYLSGGFPSLELTGDGTVQRLTAQSESTLSEAAAECIAAENSESVIVAGDNLHLLEDALRRRDFPVSHFSKRSLKTAISQLLPMALALCREPVDLNAMGEFLLHPESPIEDPIRSLLLQTLRARPGVGGKAWRAALSEEAGEAASDWLECERTDSSRPNPSTLARMADRLGDWVREKLGNQSVPEEQQPQWESLLVCADQFAQQVQRLDHPTRTDIQRLLDLVQYHNGPEHHDVPELGHVPVVTAAGLTERRQMVFWWDFTGGEGAYEWSWTETETEHLRGRGIVVESIGTQQAKRYAQQLRALGAAEQRLVLFTSRQRNGSDLAEHPLWARLRARASGVERLITDVDALLCHGKPFRPIGLDTVQPASLQAPHRWLKLPPSVQIPKRSCESYSSLATLVRDPFTWVCKYTAKLEAGAVWNTRFRIDQRLHGQLLHRVIERMFPRQNPPFRWQGATPSQIRQWLDSEWPAMLKEEAIPLLLEGNRHHALTLKQLAEDSILDLIEMLHHIRAVWAVADWQTRPQPFFGGWVSGNIDLLVHTDNRRPVIIDFKMGDRDRYLKETTEDRALQLAIYGHLASTDRFAPPPTCAYHLLGRREWLTNDEPFFFHSGESPPLTIPPGNSRCWSAFRRMWFWRREQLDEGTVELPRSGAESTPESAAPEPSWLPTRGADPKSDFAALHGFDESQ